MQQVGRFAEYIAHGSRVTECLHHSDSLRALPGEDECEFLHGCESLPAHEHGAPGDAAADAFEQDVLTRAYAAIAHRDIERERH